MSELDSGPHGQVSVLQAIANVISADSTLRYDAGGEGVFKQVDSMDPPSGTLIFIAASGDPFEIRVRRVTEADCDIDTDGVIELMVTPDTGCDHAFSENELTCDYCGIDIKEIP